LAPGGFVLSSFSLTSGDIVEAIEACGESAAMPVNAAMARIVGIRILRIDAERPTASRALESVLARPLWLLLCMFMEGEGWRR
jgi:hypothetical protein